MLRRWLGVPFLVLLPLLGGERLVMAAETERLYKIACPITWPGPEGPLPLTFNTVWVEWKYEADGDDAWVDDLSNTKPDTVQIDCAYGPQKRESGLRISLKVPGYAQKCNGEKTPGTWRRKLPTSCFTHPSPGEELGPVIWRIATPVNSALRLFSFGLGMTGPEIKELATKTGYDVQETPGKLILSRQDQQFIIIMNAITGNPHEITLTSTVYDSLDKVTFNFGLTYLIRTLRKITENRGYSKYVWISPDKGVILEYWPSTRKDERPSLHLIDLR